MEFKDYYKILEVDPTSSLSDIKTAFKKQAIKWHPDRNPNADTTEKMQEINEAYLILKDLDARERYDREYLKYKQFYSNAHQSEKKQTQEQEYKFDDEILKNWMRNAKRQAVDLAKQTIREVGELSVTATKAAGSKMLVMFVGYIVIGFISLLLFKACSL